MTEPKTLIATLMPFSVGIAIVLLMGVSIEVIKTLLFLVTALLIQMATNLVNDYSDIKKEALEDIDKNIEEEKEFASIDNVKLYKQTILSLYGVAGIIGFSLVFFTGLPLLYIGITGVVLSIAYSFGKPPISYTPFGDLTAGLIMGGLIPLAIVFINTNLIIWQALVLSIPVIMMVSLILTTNNTSDLERDIKSGRKTLSIILGRKNSKNLIIYGSFLAYLVIFINIGTIFHKVSVLSILGLIVAIINIKKLSKFNFTYEERPFTMMNISKLTFIIVGIYSLSLIEIYFRMK